MKPLIVINFKAYESATGKGAVALAKAAGEVAKKEKVTIIAAVQAADVYRVSQESEIDVFAQHIDTADYGAHTGATLAETVKAAGAKGTLINHSEKTLELKEIEKAVAKAHFLGLKTIVCVGSASQAKAVAAFTPDYIAIEPPELIGGDISVSRANPAIISDTVKRVRHVSATTDILVGAGVKDKLDVDKALELGAVGVLLASHITQAKVPKEAIMNLLKD
ncbi:Triosephosphate isomerase [uncultured archaeon]|nr:Triosephosphate isomerase [uncultured archaeon]